MVRIGKICILEVVKFTEQGAYLDGGPYGEILLPQKYVPENCKEEDEVEVFISFDSEDRIVATSVMPTVMVGQFGRLKVVEVNRIGAFLDWGLPKNLLVPFREQKMKMEEGKSYVVHVYVDDKSGRIVASSKILRFIDSDTSDYSEGDEVELLIASKSDIGYTAIINGAHQGVLYHNELFKKIKIGDKLNGFIKKKREDGKIDLSLEKQGYTKIDTMLDPIIQKLKLSNGFLPLNDKTDPDTIKQELGMSKKTFKKAIGALYKEKQIIITPEGIKLAEG
ncbi:MAG: S1-like domain-containing RNA-binding protein [Prolixibacteraceae bacterium]|jgi:predicted RNA-binding protein (virulence factor B family)|nr:S1-like domain-containing RNA-binding protein [Prolixibacteraceae bacterium]